MMAPFFKKKKIQITNLKSHRNLQIERTLGSSTTIYFHYKMESSVIFALWLVIVLNITTKSNAFQDNWCI